MPGYPDKIIINHGGGRGADAMIEQDMITLERLGAELVELGMVPSCNDLRDKLKSACDAHYAAEMKYHEVLRDLIAETARRIDAKVCP